MKYKDDIPANYLSKVIWYDPETGILRWRPRTPEMFKPRRYASADNVCDYWNKRMAGRECGRIAKDGYRTISVNRKGRKAHRIAWALHYGNWPNGEIDHVNGDKADNRITNLREATASQNQMNKGKTRRNTSGHKGVSWNKERLKWQSHIQINGKLKNLGLFDSICDAASAHEKMSKSIHGDFSYFTSEAN